MRKALGLRGINRYTIYNQITGQVKVWMSPNHKRGNKLFEIKIISIVVSENSLGSNNTKACILSAYQVYETFNMMTFPKIIFEGTSVLR